MTQRLFRLAAILAATGAAIAQDAPADVTYVQLEGRRVKEAVCTDVDGDGRADLVLATGVEDRNGGATQRFLQVHLRREGAPAFLPKPDRTFEVVRDVVAFAVADVHPNPGRELVVFAPSLAAGVLWTENGDTPELFRIAPIRLLWQPARQLETLDLQVAVADLDADGLEDLFVPEPGGYRALLQRRHGEGAATFETHELVVPRRRTTDQEEGEARLKAQADTLRLRLREDERDRVFTLLDCEDQLPPPHLGDWDGDGDLDVIALADRDLCVWLNDGGFENDPWRVYTLPPFQGSMLNPSNFVRVADLDGDRRLDVVFVTGRVNGDDVSSFIDVFLQADDAKLPATPTDRLLLQGFVAVPQTDDIDGDGRPELVVGSLRPDLIGTISASAAGSIDGQVNVFRNELEGGEGRFGRPVAMVEKLEVSSDVMRSRFRGRVATSFFHDVDGDGLRDFLQRTDPTRVLVKLTRVSGERYVLGDTRFELRVHEGARVFPVVDRGRVALIAIEEGQVIHAELR